MYALTGRAGIELPSLVADVPKTTLITLAGVLAACAALTYTGAAPPPLMSVAVTAAGHGALLVTALAWRDGSRRAWWTAPALVIPLIAAAALAAIAHPTGALAYVAVAAWLWARGARTPVALRYVALGAAIGAVLGAHLLLTASLTLGYRVSLDASRALAWLAYDAGVSVPATEGFFRGALFDRAQRRWPLAGAAALATVLGVGRYVADPLLPKIAEMVVGTVVYTGLLGAANCWLFHRTGSVLPGVASAVVFFLAYRLIAP